LASAPAGSTPSTTAPASTGPTAPASPGGVPAPAERQTRLRVAQSFPQPDKGDVPYAECRAEIKERTPGEWVAHIVGTQAWKDVMGSVLAEVDAERPIKGPSRSYGSEELEKAFLFQRMIGAEFWYQARDLLETRASARCRDALGFDRPRRRFGSPKRQIKNDRRLPSRTTMRRHLEAIGLDRHVAAYKLLHSRFVADGFKEFPEEMREEARAVNWDGTAVLSRYSSDERVDRVTGEIKPATMKGGGYMPDRDDNHGKSGHGFTLVAAVTSNGMPLAARLVPLATNEAKVATAIMREEFKRDVATYLDPTKVGVMKGDAGYNARGFRMAAHSIGYVPNTHHVSHADRERSKNRAAKTKASVYRINGKPNWKLNGHNELSCRCGTRGKKDAHRRADGSVSASVAGWCKSCGSVSLVAGQWRKAQKTNLVVKVLPGEEHRADWKIGNPLTFNDPLSKKYGSERFGHGEGFHGALAAGRFKLLDKPKWYSDIRQAERDFFSVFSIMHALGLEQRRIARDSAAGGGGSPPALAAA